jgi:hypothetical protein
MPIEVILSGSASRLRQASQAASMISLLGVEDEVRQPIAAQELPDIVALIPRRPLIRTAFWTI